MRRTTDADTPGRPLHLRASAVAAVAVGGLVGTPVRYELAQHLPAGAGLPRATLIVNLTGAFILGALLEALARAGHDTGWRQRARLLAGTGFCGSLTTYSTVAVEVDLLVRASRPAFAVGYAALTVVAGIAAAAAGVLLASIGAGTRRALPADPDAPGRQG